MLNIVSHHPFNLEHFIELSIDSIVWIILAFVFLICMSLLYERINCVRRAFEFVTRRCLKSLMAIVWLLGFTTYCIGSHVVDHSNFFAAAPMSIIHSTGMFMAFSDVSAIRPECLRNGLYMALFNMCHFSAIVLSLMFIIKRFEYSFVAKFRFWTFSKISRKDKHTINVFWDINEDSCNLALDILNMYKQKQRKDSNWASRVKYERFVRNLFKFGDGITDETIVFVKTFDNDDLDGGKVGFGSVFNVVGLTKREYDLISDLGHECFFLSTAKLLSKIKIKQGKNNNIIKDRLHLDTLYNVLNDQKVNEIRMFFLGDDQDANIAATINILEDETVEKKKVTIYCRARKSAKTHWMTTYEYLHQDENTRIKLVDTSYLSVLKLKKNTAFHPVNYVSIDRETGYVTSSFDSLVIGFGSTGYEAMKFLYEFGAFVKYNDKRSDFHCTVIDENMDRLKGFFNIHTPELRNDEEIELLSFAINSEEYWSKIEKVMPNLNYVVFALGSNDNTLNAVAYFCKMAAKWKNKENKLIVLVRSYHNSKYEQLKKMCDEISKVYESHKIKVEPFGSSQELFTYNIIIDNDTLEKAKKYNYRYKKGRSGETEKEADRQERLDKCWYETLGVIKSREYDIEALQEIKRKREICISSYLHEKTKKVFRDKCDKSPTLIERLCQIEHERWMAYMKINGWSRMSREQMNDSNKGVNPVQKLHVDLCPWRDLRSEQQEKIRKLVNANMNDDDN